MLSNCIVRGVFFFLRSSGNTFKNCAVHIVTVIITCSLFGSACAEDLNGNIPQCYEMLANADLFYDQCISHARFLAQGFIPSSKGYEQHSSTGAWFSAKSQDLHFVLGCAIKEDKSPIFLGLYYTAQPNAIGAANHANIRSITPDGDVTLEVDGFPVTFVAVRAFETSKIKTRWNSATTPPAGLNCADPLGVDGFYYDTAGRIIVDFSTFDDDHLIRSGLFAETMISSKYVELFPSNSPRQIIYHWADIVLIESSGALLVKSDWLHSKCNEVIPGRLAQSTLLFHQICRISGSIVSRPSDK